MAEQSSGGGPSGGELPLSLSLFPPLDFTLFLSAKTETAAAGGKQQQNRVCRGCFGGLLVRCDGVEGGGVSGGVPLQRLFLSLPFSPLSTSFPLPLFYCFSSDQRRTAAKVVGGWCFGIVEGVGRWSDDLHGGGWWFSSSSPSLSLSRVASFLLFLVFQICSAQNSSR